MVLGAGNLLSAHTPPRRSGCGVTAAIRAREPYLLIIFCDQYAALSLGSRLPSSILKSKKYRPVS